MGNSLPKPEEIQEGEENGANYEESDNETTESGSVNIGVNDDEYFISPFVKEVSIDEFRVKIEEFWLKSGGDWIEVARKEGVEYIQKKRHILRFNPQTAFLAVIYLTRVLSTTQIEMNEAEYSWAIRLMSVACLSLSAKMEEVVVPALSGFCMNEYTFNNRDIMRMELCVLNSLQWEMGLITPFAFTHFFAEKLFEIFSLQIVSSRVEHAILSSMKDVKTMCYRPSVVALAATLVAIDHRLTTTNAIIRLKINPLATELAMNIDDVILCYIRVREIVESQRTGHFGRPSVSITSVVRGRGKTHAYNFSRKL